MTARSKSLKRLATLYEAVELIRSSQLRAAVTGVAEVVRASRDEGETRRIQSAQSLVALMEGDAEARAVGTLGAEISEMRQQRLNQVRLLRETDQEEARAMHQLSREQMEQMQTLAEHSANRELSSEQRRIQASSDDRYASRRAWKKDVARQSSSEYEVPMKLA